MSIGHWALGMGHWTWGMGHGAWGTGLPLTRSGLTVHRTSERRERKGGGASSPEPMEAEVPASKLLKLTKNALALHQWTLRQLEREAIWFWSPQRSSNPTPTRTPTANPSPSPNPNPNPNP